MSYSLQTKAGRRQSEGPAGALSRQTNQPRDSPFSAAAGGPTGGQKPGASFWTRRKEEAPVSAPSPRAAARPTALPRPRLGGRHTGLRRREGRVRLPAPLLR